MSRALEIAEMFDAAETGWGVVVIRADHDAADVRDAIAVALGDLADDERRPDTAAFDNACELKDAMLTAGAAPLVSTIVLPFGPSEWLELDIAREDLRACERRLLLILNNEQAHDMAASAPNLMSVLGASLQYFSSERDFTDHQRDARLDALRLAYGFDDAEMLRRWMSEELEPDPAIAEWLVLLGEGNRLRGKQ